MGDNLYSYFVSSANILSYLWWRLSSLIPVERYDKLRQRAFDYLAKYPLPWVDLLRDVDRVLAGFVRGQT